MKRLISSSRVLIISIVFSIAMMVWPTASYPQTGKFDIGLEGGPNLTSLSGNDVLEEFNDPKIGFSGGVTFQYNFPKLVSIRTGVGYERKGAVSDNLYWTDENGIPIEEVVIHTNVDYLAVPLLARLTFGNKMKFFINAGPYVGFMLKKTSIWHAFRGLLIIDSSESFKRLDIGLSAGIGANLPIKDRFLLTLEIRNNTGLRNLSKVPLVNNGTFKTHSTNMLVGIAYRLGE